MKIWEHDICSFPEKSIPYAQCQRICLENIHADSIIWTEQVTFKNIYMYTYTHVHAVTISEKKAMNFKENLRRGSAWSEEREGRNVPVNICEGQMWGCGTSASSHLG